MSKPKIPKVSQSKTIKRVKDSQRPLKGNITFRISTDLLDSFDSICTKAGIKKVDVIEDMLKQFVNNNK